jgi:hypothetical protein
MKKYVYIPILLIAIISIVIIIIWQRSPSQFSYYYSNRIQNIQKELFNNHNIKNNNYSWNIYIPNGYNNIEKELKTIHPPSKGKHKYIFGINGCDWVVSKNGLWYLLDKKYGREQAKYIMPETYILHKNDDFNLLKSRFRGETYIMKKNIQRKNGIKITNNIKDIVSGYDNGYKIAQKYVENVFLVNRRKLNIRIYMVIIYNRSIQIYIHRDGKCIYTNKDYNNDIHDFESNITSYNMDYVIYDKNPFSIEELNQYIYRTHGVQIDLFDKIAELMTLVGRACMSHIKKSSNIKNATTYQLFGADIILDNNFIPYLLEINKGPDMRIRCDRDKILKEKVYRDIYGTLGIIKSEDNRFIRLNI